MMQLVNHLPFSVEIEGTLYEPTAPITYIKPGQGLCRVSDLDLFGEPGQEPGKVHLLPMQAYHILACRGRHDICTILSYKRQAWEGQAIAECLLIN